MPDPCRRECRVRLTRACNFDIDQSHSCACISYALKESVSCEARRRVLCRTHTPDPHADSFPGHLTHAIDPWHEDVEPEHEDIDRVNISRKLLSQATNPLGRFFSSRSFRRMLSDERIALGCRPCERTRAVGLPCDSRLVASCCSLRCLPAAGCIIVVPLAGTALVPRNVFSIFIHSQSPSPVFRKAVAASGLHARVLNGSEEHTDAAGGPPHNKGDSFSPPHHRAWRPHDVKVHSIAPFLSDHLVEGNWRPTLRFEGRFCAPPESHKLSVARGRSGDVMV